MSGGFVLYIFVIVLLAIGLGVYIIRKKTASSGGGGERARDRIRLAANETVLPTVDAWAARNGYTMTEEPDGSRTYQTKTKGTSMPVFLRVERIGDQFELQSWVRASGLGGGGEMALAAPGFVLSLPRKQARKPHNELRDELGLPKLG
jgi:hypothetical protein